MLKKISIFSLLLAAIAMGAGNDYEGRMEETVVTATGFEETQSSQIKNVTVITSEDIENKGYNSVDQIMNSVPGVVMNGGYIDIRGQGTADGNDGVSALNNVKVLVDGVELNLTEQQTKRLPLDTIAVDSIDRIEIINGGGTVLYGGGTSGGVVNIIIKKGKVNNEKGYYGRVYYQNSSYNTNKYGVSAGIKLFDGFTIDLLGETLNGKGYVKGAKNESDYLKGGFTWDLNENHRVRFSASSYDGTRVRSYSGLTMAQIAEDRRQSTETRLVPTKRKEYVLNYNGKYFDKLDLQITGFKQKYNSSIIYGGVSRDSRDRKDGVNLLANYNYGSGNLILGYNYSDASAGRSVSANASDIASKKQVNSIFIQNRHSILDNLDLITGYRYEHSKYNNFQIGRGVVAIDKDSKEKNHAYEIGANYKYSDTGNVYAKFERGFRSPNPIEKVNLYPVGSSGIYLLNDVKSEKFNTYEIGVKDMLWNSFVSATFFLTDKKDEINSVTKARFDKTYNNLDETRRYGIELFAEQYFGKLRINESFSYVNAKITGGVNKGKKVFGAVPQKWTLGASYEILNGLSVNGNFNYYSKANEDISGERKNSITTTDLYANYKHNSGFGIQAGVKNIFNKKYYTSARSWDSALNDYTYDVADERTYFVGFSYDF